MVNDISPEVALIKKNSPSSTVLLIEKKNTPASPVSGSVAVIVVM